MRSPTLAILWELWARNRGALIFAGGLMPVSAILLLLTRGTMPESPDGLDVSAFIVTFLATILSMAALFWSFSFTAVDERGRFAGFPLRLFTLPIRTSHAVLVPLTAGVAAVSLAYVAWATIILRAARETLSNTVMLTMLWHLLVLASAFVTLQVLVWFLYPVRQFRVVALSCVLFGFLVFFVWPPNEQFYGRAPLWFFVMGIFFFAMCAAAVRVVAWDRHGGWQQSSSRSSAVTGDIKSRPFASAAGAQLWFEWRRKGVFAGILIGIVMGLALLFWSVPPWVLEAQSGGAARWQAMAFGVLPALTLSLAFAVGAGFGKPDLWLPELPLSSFAAAKPVRSAELVSAKLIAALLVVALSWLVLFTCAVLMVIWCGWRTSTGATPHIAEFWLQFPRAHPLLWNWLTNPVVLPTLFAVQWHVLVAGMAPSLSGHTRVVTLCGWKTVIELSLCGGVLAWCATRPAAAEFWLALLPFITACIVGWKLVRTFVMAGRAQALLSKPERLVLALAWISLVGGIVFSAAAAHRFRVVPAELIWFLAAWLAPGEALPACFTHCAMNRHR